MVCGLRVRGVLIVSPCVGVQTVRWDRFWTALNTTWIQSSLNTGSRSTPKKIRLLGRAFFNCKDFKKSCLPNLHYIWEFVFVILRCGQKPWPPDIKVPLGGKWMQTMIKVKALSDYHHNDIQSAYHYTRNVNGDPVYLVEKDNLKHVLVAQLPSSLQKVFIESALRW